MNVSSVIVVTDAVTRFGVADVLLGRTCTSSPAPSSPSLGRAVAARPCCRARSPGSSDLTGARSISAQRVALAGGPVDAGENGDGEAAVVVAGVPADSYA
jgi:hypothetical protein